MNLVKSYDYFQPEKCRSRIHIIGCGAVGSTVAENLVRMGLTRITLYDFDKVESKNIANQMFRECDIGKEKVDAVADQLKLINPDIEKDLKIERAGYSDQRLDGYVILCVDNIDLRREIATKNRTSPNVKAMFDFRIRMTDAQHYAADWADPVQVDAFLRSMEFSHEEAEAATPMSACHVTLSVVTTVRTIVAFGVQNMIDFIRTGGEQIRRLLLVDLAHPALDVF